MTKKDAEFAVLEVAFLLTAIDGSVDESERRMFDKLSAECKNVDVDQAKSVLRFADKSVKRLLAAFPKNGIHGKMRKEEERKFIAKFMKEVDSVCDWSDFARSSARVRKAFAMWISMCLADGNYTETERRGISELAKMFNGFPLVSDDYLASVEKTVASIQATERKIATADSLEASRRLHARQNLDFERLTALITD